MTEETQDQGRSRKEDAVLVCLAASEGPLTVDAIMATFAKVESSRRFEPDELLNVLGELKKESLVEELNEGIFRITGHGRTAIGPLAERPLSEI